MRFGGRPERVAPIRLPPHLHPRVLQGRAVSDRAPDGTDVPSLTSFDGADDEGNISVFCLWDVVGHPLTTEP